MGIAAVLLSAIALGNGAAENARLARAKDDIVKLRAAVRAWAELGQTSYVGLSVPALAAAGVLPQAQADAPWGAVWELAPRAAGGYWITLDGAPDGAVARLAADYQSQALEVVTGPGRLSLAFQ
jgi:hypothetical protein